MEAYRCPAGIPTIGYDTTVIKGKPVEMGLKISRQQAEQFISDDLVKFEEAVEKYVTVPLTQNQFDALVSFTYNLGAGSLQQSTLLKKLNAKDYESAANEFLKWNKAREKVLDGLRKRRQAERALFLES